MSNENIDKINGETEGESLVEKLGEIPVVNDGWTSAVDYYGKLKEYNSVTKFTLGIAESSVKRAAEISSPVVGQYKNQIDSVNNFACNKLDALETKYPLIKQPSVEVKDACLDYVQPVVDKVKPVVNCVNSAVETSKKGVDTIKETSTKLVTGARDFSVDTVTGAVNMTLATPPGRLLTRTVDGALNIAEDLMDKYIPEELEEGEAAEDADDERDQDNDLPAPETSDNGTISVSQMEPMEPTPQRVAVHFRAVSEKFRQRMFRKAMRDYQGAKTKTFDALGKLNNHINLIEYAKTHLDGAKGKASEIWDKIKEENQEEKDGSEQTGMIEEKIVSLGRILMQRVKTGVEKIETITQEAGQFVKDPVSKSKEYKDLIVHFSNTHSLKDLSQSTLDNVRANLKTVSQKLHSMVDGFKMPEWMANTVSVEMESLGLDENDEQINNSLRAPEEPEVVGNNVHG